MRWKYILSGLAVCLSVAALWYVWGSGLFIKKNDPASLVPGDTLLFAEQKNIGELIDGFNASRLGQSLAKIDIKNVAAGTGFDSEQSETLEQVVSTAKELGNNAVVRKFCDDSLSFAFFAGKTDAVIANAERSLPMRVLLIARPRQKAELLEVMSAAFTGDVKQGVVSYGKNKVTHFTSDGTTFYASVVEGLFLFALDQSTLTQSLDLMAQPEVSLAQRAEFQELKGKYEKTDFFVYTSPEAIRAEMENHQQQEWSSQNLAGLRCSAYGVWREGGHFYDRSITLIDKNKLSTANRRFLDNPPQINDTLSHVPADVQLYYWSNTLALRSIMELLREGDPAGETVYAEFAEKFRELTGHDLEQVLANIADGFSLQVHRGAADGLIPVPSISVFFPVKDSVLIEDALSKALGNMGLEIRNEQYRNRNYRSCNLGLPGDIELLFGFLDGYLFFGSNRKMLEEIMNTIEDSKGLKESPDFAAFVSAFEQPNNAVAYIKVSEITEGIKGLAGWAGAILALENRELAGKSQVLIDGLLNPVFDGISMISVVGTRTFFDQDRIIMESMYQIAPEQLPAQGK